jgi:hypothetical protein
MTARAIAADATESATETSQLGEVARAGRTPVDDGDAVTCVSIDDSVAPAPTLDGGDARADVRTPDVGRAPARTPTFDSSSALARAPTMDNGIAPVHSPPMDSGPVVTRTPRMERELGGAHSLSTPAARAQAAWFVAPMFLAATATGVIFVIRGPDRFFGLGLGALFALALAWILISVLFPAKPDRTCPSCGRERLRRIDERTTRGVVCGACGHADPDQSSFLMAEEEGPLETIVLAERANSALAGRTSSALAGRTRSRESDHRR